MPLEKQPGGFLRAAIDEERLLAAVLIGLLLYDWQT
jgi:hypothetical protein